MAPQITNPSLPQGSLILVTAVNGFIASHVVDQLLRYGYAVRGTVRSRSRCAWMEPLLTQRHPNSQFELVEVPDISVPECYDAAMKGVAAVVHTAASTELPDDEEVIAKTIGACLNALKGAEEANKRGEKIQRVVLTGSAWVVAYPRPNTPGDLTEGSYDTFAEQTLANPNTPAGFRPLMTYVVSKKRSEQESWKWKKGHPDCGFAINVIMPATCIGPVLSPENQAYPSTAGFVRSLYEGKGQEIFDWLEPQWYVDVRDAALLHVAGTVLAGVESQRIFGYAETYTWPGIADALEREMGIEKVPIVLKDRGRDLSNPLPKDRSEGYLKRLGQPGWMPFEESVKANIRSYYPKV